MKKLKLFYITLLLPLFSLGQSYARIVLVTTETHDTKQLWMSGFEAGFDHYFKNNVGAKLSYANNNLPKRPYNNVQLGLLYRMGSEAFSLNPEIDLVYETFKALFYPAVGLNFRYQGKKELGFLVGGKLFKHSYFKKNEITPQLVIGLIYKIKN